MDHSMYVFTPNGVPQESKLATYMNRQNTSTPLTSSVNLNHSFSKVSIGSPSPKKVTPQSPEFVPSSARIVTNSSASPNFFNSFPGLVSNTSGPGYSHMVVDSGRSGTDSPHLTPHPSPPPLNINNCSPIPHASLEKPVGMHAVAAYQENVGGTTYFYTTSADNSVAASDSLTSASLNSSLSSGYQVYPGTPSHISALKARGGSSSFFISEDARIDILHRNALILMQADPEQFPDLPHEVDNYHELCPIEPIPANPLPKSHVYLTSMYKATHVKTGMRFCLRRIHGFRLQNPKCMTFVDQWKKLVHTNVVSLKEVFTTKAFGDNSLMFVYDFHPGSETLLAKHFSPDQSNGYVDPFASDPNSPRPYSQHKNSILRHQQNNKLPESLIWNYIMQLTSALRVIHSSGMACRSLDPTKIIISMGNRLRLSCVGVMDLIDTSSNLSPLATVQHNQQEDLSALGKLVLALACKSTMAVQRDNISTAMEVVTRFYTLDLRNLIMYLLSTQRRSVIDLMPMIGARFYIQLDSIQTRVDALQNDLAKEVENGRLFRLLVKLGTINERPEHNLDSAWSETGDRYMLKLYRDYLFHQVTESGRPWLDMAHVVNSLNKLDVGAPEQVTLVSRDEQSVLVVSYAELKHCLEQSFDELLSSSSNTDHIT